jgi:hypothetical protein
LRASDESDKADIANSSANNLSSWHLHRQSPWSKAILSHILWISLKFFRIQMGVSVSIFASSFYLPVRTSSPFHLSPRGRIPQTSGWPSSHDWRKGNDGVWVYIRGTS